LGELYPPYADPSHVSQVIDAGRLLEGALAVVSEAHLGLLSLAVVAVGLAVTTANRKIDFSADERHASTGAFHVGKKADPSRALAKFLRATGEASKTAALLPGGARAARQNCRQNEREYKTKPRFMHDILPLVFGVVKFTPLTPRVSSKECTLLVLHFKRAGNAQLLGCKPARCPIGHPSKTNFGAHQKHL
jgi:hypothetical protein